MENQTQPIATIFTNIFEAADPQINREADKSGIMLKLEFVKFPVGFPDNCHQIRLHFFIPSISDKTTEVFHAYNFQVNDNSHMESKSPLFISFITFLVINTVYRVNQINGMEIQVREGEILTMVKSMLFTSAN